MAGMDFNVRIDGLDQIVESGEAVRQAVANEINKALYVSAKKVEDDAKKSILDGQKTGRTYRRSAIKATGKRVIGSRIKWIDGKAVNAGNIKAKVAIGYIFHRASAPGEAPASDTGHLAGSINSSMASNGGEAIVSAGSGAVKYAKWLEFGTLGVVGHSVSFSGGKVSETGEIRRGIAARPFLFPALERNKAWINAKLQEAFKTALKQF
jgi:hypothetical protein